MGKKTRSSWIWLIALIGVIVPRRLRADWRQEWEAELRYRESLLAEWDQQSRLMEDLLHRMGPYDDGGERRRKFGALSTVRINSVPAGAHVSITGLRQEGHEFIRSPERRLGDTPTTAGALLPGAYLITLTAFDGQSVRRPIMIGHGVTLTVNVELPRGLRGR